ncbi:hypothetical protein ACIHFD_38115 [Nonomuraea sp. NPDC051941]|uniref:hypothetical protein n=1 Tax=Nonomuraea sp. NPDC051941 TaxID=3364373 RepID=UPI0037CC74EA
MRVPGTPGFWVYLAAAQLIPAWYVSGEIGWLVAPAVALLAMIAAVVRAYQDAAHLRTAEDSPPDEQ